MIIEPTTFRGPSGVPFGIAKKFEEVALEVAGRGYRRYSADAISHRLRWHFAIEQGKRDFKLNNNWTAGLARWFLERHPELPGFFEVRERYPGADGGGP
jgi:hypothetical protein